MAISDSFYFGEVDPDYGDTSDTFQHNGKYWYYRVDVDTEDDSFNICDTCDRMVPFALSDIEGLKKIVDAMVDAQQYETAIVADLKYELYE